jgi:hypothetical protein
MLTDLHHLDSHFVTQHAPRGGVAPLRRDLALHDHIERQRRLAEEAQASDTFAAARALLAAIVRIATAAVARRQAPKAGHYKTAR